MTLPKDARNKMRVLLVASVAPHPLATGWRRRVYQLEQDLKEVCYAEVEVFNAGRAVREYLPPRPQQLLDLVKSDGLRWLRERLSREARRSASDPLRIVRGASDFSTDMLRGAALGSFKAFLEQRGPFDALVCDNVMFSSAVSLAADRGVPCYYALHHLESLHTGLDALLAVTQGTRQEGATPTEGLRRVGSDLADEIVVLSRAQQVFAISRMEHEFLAATGIRAEYYPYRPRGETLSWCERICSARQKVTRKDHEPVRFLSSGTGTVHNRRSLALVVQELFSSGMPPGCELVVTGIEPHEINDLVPGLAADGVARGIHVVGRLPDEDFEQLLICAAALLIPNYFGFGALTRFPDAAACGVPVLTNVPARVSGLESHETVQVEEPKEWWNVINRFAHPREGIFIAFQSTGSAGGGSALEKIKLEHLRSV